MAKEIKRNWDFYAIQKKQWRSSLFLFLLLCLFYFFAVAILSSAILLTIGFLFYQVRFYSGSNLHIFLLFNLLLAVLIAAFHLYDARKFGAEFIRKRLRAKFPDLSDRYHKRFSNTVDEIRIACGLPRVTPYILPDFAVNSMALIEADNSPSILVTEGLLAELTRDELEAVIAHELAHITRGDSFYITLVCSLANFFERFRQSLEPETSSPGNLNQKLEERGGTFPIYFAATLSYVIMHLLSTLISRQRELLADAAAVEISRNPRALARAIYTAHQQNSFVGDFNLTYSPLFIVPPESKGITNSLYSRFVNSHPPLMTRISQLADMVPTSPEAIIQEIWDIRKTREEAKAILDVTNPPAVGKEIGAQDPDRIWNLRDPDGHWQGPFTLMETLFKEYFTPFTPARNLQEGIQAQAREFPQINRALRRKDIARRVRGGGNLCPRCRIPLRQQFYEGVPVGMCTKCGGKLIGSEVVNRVVVRREVGFSKDLMDKAREFKAQYMVNPIRSAKRNARNAKRIRCPSCGDLMLPRPYTYHYAIPLDKCFHCHKIWFDGDELEILQILIENR
jgi:Zn-dependent protease with chaperone function/Zn-finger nucleic acid-binding protein